ncbi:hypothetical protein ACFQ9X_13420 [Catenulispora yoronensis]
MGQPVGQRTRRAGRGQGSTATLPPLVPWRGWLHWLVPPGGAAGRWTPSGALLSVLSEPPRASSL